MTRSFYGQTAADYGSSPETVGGVANVNVFDSVTLYIFDTNDYTTCTDVGSGDALLDQSGSAASAITAAATGLIYFQGPDGAHTDLFGCVDATPDADSVFYRFPPDSTYVLDAIETLQESSTPALDDITDVNTTGRSDGDALKYVAATQTWVAGSVASGSGLPSGGTTDQALIKQSATTGDADWETRGFVGSGGTTGQVYRKDSGTNYDASWQDIVVPLTQAEYDALDPDYEDVLYVITDAAAFPPQVGAAGSAVVTFDTETPFDTLSVPLPAGVVAGDLLMILSGLRSAVPATTEVSTPSGWTSLANVVNGTGQSFSNGGAVRAQAFYKTATGSEGSQSLSVGASYDPLHAVMLAVTGQRTGVTATTATDTDDDTSAISFTGAANLSLTQNDLLIAFFANRSGNSLGMSDAALAATGCTLSDQTLHVNQTTTTGNNSTIMVWSARVASGTSSAAPTFTATSTYSPFRSDGSMVFIRVAA